MRSVFFGRQASSTIDCWASRIPPVTGWTKAISPFRLFTYRHKPDFRRHVKSCPPLTHERGEHAHRPWIWVAYECHSFLVLANVGTQIENKAFYYYVLFVLDPGHSFTYGASSTLSFFLSLTGVFVCSFVCCSKII
jgi:hypothetical protein